MRKKTKIELSTVLRGGALTAIADVLIQAYCLYQEGKPFKENWDLTRTLKFATLGGLGGYIIGNQIYKSDLKNRSIAPFNSNLYLKKVIQYYKLENSESFPTLTELAEWLRYEFYNQLNHLLVAYPMYNGSFKRKTALNSADIDIILPFANQGISHFDLNEKIQNVTYNLSFADANISYRKQAHSIGLKIKLFNEVYDFDIVGVKAGQYFFKNGKCTIIEREQGLFTENTSWRSTNIYYPNEELVNRPCVREAILLMKVYKKLEGWNLPSILIQKLCIRSLKNTNTTSTFQNFVTAAEYIANHLEDEDWMDTFNSKASMSKSDKRMISSQIWEDLDQIRNTKCYLEDLFQLPYNQLL